MPDNPYGILIPVERKTEVESKFHSIVVKEQAIVINKVLSQLTGSEIRLIKPMGTYITTKQLIDSIKYPALVTPLEVKLDNDHFNFWLITYLKDILCVAYLSQKLPHEDIIKKCNELSYGPTEWEKFIDIINNIRASLQEKWKDVSKMEFVFNQKETGMVDFSKTNGIILDIPEQRLFILQYELNIKNFPPGWLFFLYQHEFADALIKNIVKDPEGDLAAFAKRCRLYTIPETQTPSVEGPCVLIVDDAAPVRKILSFFLKEKGYKVVEAANVYEAVDMLQKENIDVILLDIMLPEIDGISFCQRLKEYELTSHIPIIFCTAKGTERDVLFAVRAGADDYIVKPFTKQAVISKIEEVLAKKKKQEKSI